MNDRTLRVLEFYKIRERLIAKTESSLGKGLAEKNMPSINFKEIVQLQKETTEAVNLVVQKGSISLGAIHDLSYHVKRAEIGSFLYPEQLLEVSDTLRAARNLKTLLKEKKDDEKSFPIIGSYVDNLYTFKSIEDRINECIVSAEEISDHASPALRQIRRLIESKNDSIKHRLNAIISSSQNQKILQEAIITIRQDRYVVPVKQEYRNNFPGLIHDQSSSGATVFIEPMAIVELNNELRELRIKEKVEIERILTELTALVGEKTQEIKSNQVILAQLDYIFARGKLSVSMKAVEPEMNETKIIRIKNGRHPLINEVSVVPTSIWLGETFHTLVITGPNTGGKTVTLKTVGLLNIMAQAGLHVPADYGTKLSVFENIFADIGDEQSIEQSLSTFSSHMTNIVNILENVTGNSLVLLDELGAGTDPTEGAALAIAILEHLYEIGVRTLATTHYTEIKQYALTAEGVQNASVEFDIETLSPTYRLLIGVPGKSNAFEISKRLGLEEKIVDKARDLISKEDIEFENLLSNIEKDKRVAEQEKDEALKLKLLIMQQKEEYEKKNIRLMEQKDKIIKEAREEARKLLKNAKEESEQIIKELRGLSDEAEEKEKNKKIEESRTKLRNSLDDVTGNLTFQNLQEGGIISPKHLRIGDSVIILSLNQKGNVGSLPDQNGNLLVQAGIMKINVNVTNLRMDKENKEKERRTDAERIVGTKVQSIKTSIDLRGQMLEEALLNTDKYLDDAYISGLKEITVIHGKGTGVLRDGIKQFLKGHNHVRNFRDGAYGEGGIGVTVVELK